MAESYNSSEVEAKWQKKWEDDKVYEVDLAQAKNPYYSMVMLPYPSGDRLHVGHWYNYAPADSYSRYMRMKGYDVFSPMGFDAFGLPAENYAIKTGVHPNESITSNTENMTQQLKRMGCMYDWDKTVNTSRPEYYKWTQWLFLQMFKNDLAYRKNAEINWCSSCQTVLANEQAQDGTCERCGTDVVLKPMTQWYWRLSNYAEKLLDGLDSLDWPLMTKYMQHEWIGKSEGVDIDFKVSDSDEIITVYTTRPDTIYGATFMVLAPEHPLVRKLTTDEQSGEVNEFLQRVMNKSERQRKIDVEYYDSAFTGSHVVNPITKEQMPVYIAEYILMGYGRGAVMAVPAHDTRDYDFAKRREDLKDLVKCVIEPDSNEINFRHKVYPVGQFGVRVSPGVTYEDVEERQKPDQIKKILKGEFCWTGGGKIINSGELNGLSSEEARKKVIEIVEKNKLGNRITNYKLRDWSVSRQRYWGAPIPIVYDPEGNPHPIPEEHLPWLLPTDVEFKPTGTSPLAQSKELKDRTEKIFGKGWTPEVDTMDTFVCSSFYHLRYLAEGSDTLVPKDIEKKWMPVDMYIGGPEHACMHLIYARFVAMALKDFGFIESKEPYKKLVHQGLITNNGVKMSKSKGNVVSPDEFVQKHGSDVFRMYLMFMGPFTEGGDWSDTGIKGVERFVQRLWNLVMNKKVEQVSAPVKAKLHATIQKCTTDIERLHFNTVISALMEFLNLAEKEGVDIETAQTITRLIAPLAPHLAEELWEHVGNGGFVIDQSWPEFNPELLKTDTITIVVQINGKVRAEMEVDTDISEADVIALAKSNANVQKYLEGAAPKKEIYVKGKLVSLVV